MRTLSDMLDEAYRLKPPHPVTALGIDPGETCGMLVATWAPGERKAVMVRAFQCNYDAAGELLAMVLDCYTQIDVAGMEQFRAGLGRRSPRTRDLQERLTVMLADHGLPPGIWPAADVKPWSGYQTGERRLSAAGLLDATAGQGHARDSGRYCVYAAVMGGLIPDPLSKRTAVPR